jgi:starch synthase
MGLPVDPTVPIVGIVTRLADQKGVSELFGPAYGSAFRICSEIKLQMVVLGAGELWCENELSALNKSLPNFSAYIGYDESLSHLIEAGSDFFLMPSRYEPCGLNQMYSLLYGTLPIVRRTGGLADTVENYNEQTGEGTGFILDNLTPQSIYDTVGWAAYAWYNKKDHIEAMQKRGMAQQFGWDTSAKRYAEVYENALSGLK